METARAYHLARFRDNPQEMTKVLSNWLRAITGLGLRDVNVARLKIDVLAADRKNFSLRISGPETNQDELGKFGGSDLP